MRWTIYCHTHDESGRHYIGLTKHSMMKRWNRHIYASNRVKNGIPERLGHFPNAIRKYGKDAFSHRVLEVHDSLESANEAEDRLIEKYGTRNPKFGFNLAKGGGTKPVSVSKNPWDDPTYRMERTSESNARWANPEMRAKNISSSRTALDDPEVKNKIRERNALVMRKKHESFLKNPTCIHHGPLSKEQYYATKRRNGQDRIICKACVKIANARRRIRK